MCFVYEWTLICCLSTYDTYSTDRAGSSCTHISIIVILCGDGHDTNLYLLCTGSDSMNESLTEEIKGVCEAFQILDRAFLYLYTSPIFLPRVPQL